MAQMQNCQACGATIYPEHIDQGRAGRWGGKLLCAVCYAEQRAQPVPAAAEPADPVVELAAAPAAPQSVQVEDEPISLVDAPETEAAGAKIQAFGARAGAQRKQFKRKAAASGQGACRVRTFHSKIAVESIEFMDNAINEWLDDNPEIEVKFVTTTIGLMAGKHPEPNLILNLWY